MISVIIPTYNRPLLIGNSLKSVLEQTVSDLEIIVVDGSNNEDTKKIIFSICDQRIKYLKINNISAAHSRNIGIDSAKGEFVAFNDDDDIWCKNKIAKQLASFRGKTSGKIVYSTFVKASGKYPRKTPDQTVLRRNGNIYNELLYKNFIGLPTVMLPLYYCQEVKFDENLQCLEDWDWVIRLAKLYSFEFIEESLVTVNDTPKSVNKSNYSVKATAYKIIYDKYCNDIQVAPQRNAKHLLSIGSNLCLSGDLVTGRKYLLESLRADMNTPSVFVSYLLTFLGRTIYILCFKLFEKLTHSQP